jgi:hypothetical protein
MKTKTLSVIFIVLSFSGYCQKSTKTIAATSGEAVKVNGNYHTTFGSGFTIGELAPAVMRSTKQGNWHELELNTLRIGKSNTSIYDPYSQRTLTTETSRINLALRYQYTLSFRNEARFNPQIGLSLLGGYFGSRTESNNSDTYPRTYRGWNVALAISPQFRYNFTSRFFMDMAIPVDMARFGGNFQRIKNPAIPIRQQRNGGFEYEAFEDLKNNTLQVRLGVGMKI